MRHSRPCTGPHPFEASLTRPAAEYPDEPRATAACFACGQPRSYRAHQGFWWRLLTPQARRYRRPRPGSLEALLAGFDADLEVFRQPDNRGD